MISISDPDLKSRISRDLHAKEQQADDMNVQMEQAEFLINLKLGELEGAKETTMGQIKEDFAKIRNMLEERQNKLEKQALQMLVL